MRFPCVVPVRRTRSLVIAVALAHVLAMPLYGQKVTPAALIGSWTRQGEDEVHWILRADSTITVVGAVGGLGPGVGKGRWHLAGDTLVVSKYVITTLFSGSPLKLLGKMDRQVVAVTGKRLTATRAGAGGQGTAAVYDRVDSLDIRSPTLAEAFAAVEADTVKEQRIVEASSFATAEVRVRGRLVGAVWGDTPEEGPSRITITYGQPHARGRKIMGGVVPYDQVWRFGANLATILRTDVDLTIGGVAVPQGVYSLWALPSEKGWQLIINKQVGQWGMNYDDERDLARIPLQRRELAEPVESFTIYLIPDLDKPGTGRLKIVWENTELTTDWAVAE